MIKRTALVFAVEMQKIIFILLCTIALVTPAFADTNEDVTEVLTDTGVPTSDQDEPSGFHGILGGALFSTHKVIGDGGLVIVALPLVVLTYKDLAYWTLGGGGVWLLGNDDRSLRFGAGMRFQGGWHPGEDTELAGMEQRKGSIDGYLNGKWRTSLATIGAHYYHDIGHVSGGDSASLRLSHIFRVTDDLRLTPSIGAIWQNSERVGYYYGVKPGEATPLRPAYNGSDAINLNAGLAGSYRLPHTWSLLGGVFMTRFGDGIVDSPIVTRRFSTVVYGGAGWRF